MISDCKLNFLFFSFSWYNTYVGLVVHQVANTKFQGGSKSKRGREKQFIKSYIDKHLIQDGLVSVLDLTTYDEEDALLQTLNTESSVVSKAAGLALSQECRLRLSYHAVNPCVKDRWKYRSECIFTTFSVTVQRKILSSIFSYTALR